MKLIVTVLLVGLSSMGVVAQNTTLTYSRTLLVDNNTDTVPAGYVWKVENVLVSSGPKANSGSYSSVPTLSNPFTVLVNGLTINISEAQTSFPSSGYYSAHVIGVNYEAFPLWLPTGSTLAAGTNVQYISVIEFKENP